MIGIFPQELSEQSVERITSGKGSANWHRGRPRVLFPGINVAFAAHYIHPSSGFLNGIIAYQVALRRCSTQWARWFIVPADRKWYRNAVVARIVRATLEALDLTYPSEMPGLDQLRIE
jgi:hypothetical protein